MRTADNCNYMPARQVASGPTYRLVSALLGILSLFFSGAVLGASFDCDKARLPVEKLICEDAELSRKDEILAAVYSEALKKSKTPEKVIASQRAWLRSRNQCSDSSCILRAYDKRFDELTGRTERHEHYFKREPRSEGKAKSAELSHPYVLIKGQGRKVCKAYQENLNSYSPKSPFKCNRPVNTEIPGFGHQPDWIRRGKAPSGQSTHSYERKMTDFLWQRDVNPAYYQTVTEWPTWEGTPEQLKRAKRRFEYDRRQSMLTWTPPYFSVFDIDNDGTSEPVYFERPCGTSFGSRFAVLTPNWKHIDYAKTERLMQHKPFNRKGRDVFRPLLPGEVANPYAEKYGYQPIPDAWHELYYDIFEFNGTAYFDMWWAHPPSFGRNAADKEGRLRVFKASPGGVKEICAYGFEPSTD